ncbi:MAG: hypothetical protein F4W92_05295 [Gammaproteobacteria bacterium]|nr:hypothetical protein [Gammaproteobacteria bacterium]
MRMHQNEARTNQLSPGPIWLWISVVGLGLSAVVVVCLVLYWPGRPTPEEPIPPVSESRPGGYSSLPTTAPTATVDTSIQFPPLKFPLGSIEEACGVNEFPPYWIAEETGTMSEVRNRALESVTCQTALENHVKTIHPYVWAAADDYRNRAAAFIKVDTPLTFERVFADPVGDSLRVESALSRPECLLKGNEKNWKLKEICHADSFFNFALINHFCFDGGVRKRRHTEWYSLEDNPSPKQDRFMWKQVLETDWMEKKCEGLDSTLAQIHALVMSVSEANWPNHPQEQLIKLAARLGDEAAGLTWVGPTWRRIGGDLPSGGYQFGRFAELFASEEWQSLITTGTTWRGFDTGHSNRQFSFENFIQAIELLARDGKPSTEQNNALQFNWYAVVEYLCVPIYIRPSDFEQMGIKPVKLQSCKQIVQEVRQLGINSPTVIAALDKFEQVALELEVFE